MKKSVILFSIFFFISFTINTVNTFAQAKIYSQGFYTMKDLNLSENVIYTVQNSEPYAEGLLIIVASDKKIQQLIRIQPSAIQTALIPLKSDYRFIIYGDIRLSFS